MHFDAVAPVAHPKKRGLLTHPSTFELRRSFIDAQIIQLFQSKRLSPERVREMKRLLTDLSPILKDAGIDLDLKCSGSVNSGFATWKSDLDLALILPTNWFQTRETREQAKMMLDRLSPILRTYPGYKSHKVLDTARTPIAKCEIMSSGGVDLEVDLIPHPFGLHGFLNSSMLRLYSEIHPVVPILGITVKVWAANRKINSTRTGDGLSSYTYIILLIAFLQTKGLLPRLQTDVQEPRIIDGCDFSFQEDVLEHQVNAETLSETPANLLFEFFSYYAHFDWDNEIVDIKEIPPLKTVPDPQIVVLDPFIRERNLADVLKKSGSVQNLKFEFQRAHSKLSNPYNTLEDVLAESD